MRYGFIGFLVMVMIATGQAWGKVAIASLAERVKEAEVVVLGRVKDVVQGKDEDEPVHLITFVVKEALKGEAEETIVIQQSVSRRNHKPEAGTELIYFLKKGKGHFALAMRVTANSTASKEQVDEVRKAVAAEKGS